jgi:cell division protein FtsQ
MTQLLRGDRADVATRRSARRIIVAVAVISLLAVGSWAVAFSPLLGARRLVVHGTHQLTAAQVRTAAAVRHGAPLLRLDTGAVAGRVEALPDIASARVQVTYPSTVVISVTERVAVGYLAAGSSSILVDRTGTQFRTVAAAPRALPRFQVPAGSPGMAAARAAATVADALTPAVRAKLASIDATDPLSIRLLLSDGRIVRWGSADRSADKARVLPALLSRPGTMFDVSDPDVVVAH